MKRKLTIGAIGAVVASATYVYIGNIGVSGFKLITRRVAERRDRRIQRKIERRHLRRLQCELADNERHLKYWNPSPEDLREVQDAFSAYPVGQKTDSTSIIKDGDYGPGAAAFMSGKSLDDIAAAASEARGGVFPDA